VHKFSECVRRILENFAFKFSHRRSQKAFSCAEVMTKILNAYSGDNLSTFQFRNFMINKNALFRVCSGLFINDNNDTTYAHTNIMRELSLSLKKEYFSLLMRIFAIVCASIHHRALSVHDGENRKQITMCQTTFWW
jgi:hypothetical protein